MTGFGRAIFKNNKEDIVIELKSVNHRFLEINFKSSVFLLHLSALLIHHL